MYWVDLKEGYTLFIDEDDQCFTCVWEVKKKCPLLDAITDHEAIDFVDEDGMTVADCLMYEENKLRVVK
jgi:hypothetical protein